MRPIIKKIWGNEIVELTDRLKRIKSGDRANAEFFVFKCTNKLLSTLERDSRSRKEITDRAQGKAVYILLFQKKKDRYGLYEIFTEKVELVKKTGLLDRIRVFDLREVIERTDGDCFIDAPNNVHFITPSGKHTTRFLRLTDAIYSYNALDRISFWLQLYVSKSSAVIIDTWSISSIVLRTLQLLDSDIPFDCFHEHIKKNDLLALKTLNKFSRRIKGNKPVLFLVGISSSGDFFNALPALLERSSIRNPFVALSIYGFKNTPESVEMMARLENKVNWYDSGSCEYCKTEERKATYEIDSKYYFPRKYKEKPVRFTKYLLMKDDKKSKCESSVFIHKYGGNSNVLVVHKDDPNDGVSPRHHAFYIDVTELLKVPSFILDLDKKIDEIVKYNGRPEVVVCPPHGAAEKIVVHLRNCWPSTEFIFDHNLRSLANPDKNNIKNAEHICFIDDVVISGSRIEGYLRTLREEIGGGNLGKLKKVSWFPLVLRTSSELNFERIKDSLTGHESSWVNNLYFVAKIVLPDWVGPNECPWCQEDSVLGEKIGPLWVAPDWYKDRLSVLRNTYSGILESPLFVTPFSTHQTLGAASPLGEEGLSEMQVLFLVACGLQRLRSEGDSALGMDNLFFRHSLFWTALDEDEKCGTLERFSEPLIQSCFIRAVKLNEWSRTVWGSDAGLLEQKISLGSSDELIGETVLFYMRSSSSKKMKQPAIDRIKSINQDEAVEKLLSALSCIKTEQKH